MGIFAKYFENKDELSKRDYASSRICFIFETALSTGSGCFLAGVYLTKIIAILGASEAQSNFILSLSMPAGFLQLLIPLLASRMTFKKGFVFVGRFFETLLMTLVFMIPLFSLPGWIAIWIIGILVFIKHSFGWIMTPFYSEILMNCLSHDGNIGKFCGTRDAIVYTVSCISTFFAGLITKYFVGDMAKYGFMWLAVIALALWIPQMVSLFFIKEPYSPKSKSEKSVNLIEIIKRIFKIQKLKPYLRYEVLFTVGTNMSGTLMTILCIQRLGMSLEIISYLSVAHLVLRIILAPIFGGLSDKIGSKKMIFIGSILTAAVYIIHGAMTVSNVIVLKTITTVILCIANCAKDTSFLAFKIESIPEEDRSSYMSCISSLTLVLSYIASLAATTFMSIASGLNITVARFTFNELNILLFIGAGIVALSAITLISRKKNAE